MISIKQQINRYHALDNWFYSPQGISAGRLFIEALLPFLYTLQGDILLQIGPCATNPWLNSLNYTHKWIASPYFSHQPNHIQTSLNQLPLDRNRVDCIIAPLAMECLPNFMSLLDEIDRILKPMGHIIIFGINPLSMWGLAAKMGLLPGGAQQKLQSRFSFNLNRACLARGFELCSLTNFGYIPPVQSKACIQRFIFMNEIGKMLWPFPANLYCYIAQKYEPGYPLQPYFTPATFGAYSASI